MPYHGSYTIHKRSKAGKALDRAYARHEIGYTYYNKVKNKSKYWEQSR